MEQKRAILKHALKYEKLGWFVLPVHSVEKRPLIKWAHRKDRRPTPEEINGWYTKWENARVGIASRSVFICLFGVLAYQKHTIY